jgi:hypothetical protein
MLLIALLGGMFAVLAFIHFASDFILQSHSEAMVKHNNWRIRSKHCAIYTASFIPILWLAHFSLVEWLIALNVLFWSHHLEDTYYPVFLWAKYIRRPPEMTEPRKQVGIDGYVIVLPPDPKAGFIDFVQTPLGKILMIAIDQIIHLAFLFPIAYMMLRHAIH